MCLLFQISDNLVLQITTLSGDVKELKENSTLERGTCHLMNVLQPCLHSIFFIPTYLAISWGWMFWMLWPSYDQSLKLTVTLFFMWLWEHPQTSLWYSIVIVFNAWVTKGRKRVDQWAISLSFLFIFYSYKEECTQGKNNNVAVALPITLLWSRRTTSQDKSVILELYFDVKIHV